MPHGSGTCCFSRPSPVLWGGRSAVGLSGVLAVPGWQWFVWFGSGTCGERAAGGEQSPTASPGSTPAGSAVSWSRVLPAPCEPRSAGRKCPRSYLSLVSRKACDLRPVPLVFICPLLNGTARNFSLLAQRASLFLFDNRDCFRCGGASIGPAIRRRRLP